MVADGLFIFYDANVSVDCTPHGQYEYTLHLHESDVPIPWAWQDRNDQFIDASRGQLHHDVMLCWVEERVFPKERHNAADILHSIGLSDYDQFEVLKATRLRHRYGAFGFVSMFPIRT